jgi:hypothetical protein
MRPVEQPRRDGPDPFMGVGSEVYGAVMNGRRGVGIELKPAYYRQAKKNLAEAAASTPAPSLFAPGFAVDAMAEVA